MGSWFEADRPAVLGHRGFTQVMPENTLGAFRAALHAGADGVELDVRLSRDGVAVVVHDADLARVAGRAQTARVDELSAAELERVTLSRGETVPSLAAVLDWGATSQCLLNIELKPDPGRATQLLHAVERDLARATVPPRRIVLSCFELELAEQLRQSLSGFAVALLCDHISSDIDRWFADSVGTRACEERPLLLHPVLAIVQRTSLEAWQAAGAKLGVWGVNTREDLLRFLALLDHGLVPELVITDDPPLVLPALATRTWRS